MIRYLMAFFFFLLYAGDDLGLSFTLGLGLSSKNILLYLILTGVAINAAVVRNRSVELMSAIIPFGLLVVYAIITWIVAAFILDYPEYSARASFIRLKSSLADQFLMFIVFFYGAIEKKDAFWLFRVMIWIVVFGNVVTIIDAFNIPNLGLVEAVPSDGRFEGFIGQANEYGSFLVLFLPISLGLYMSQNGKARVIASIGMLATALALILTFSRGAYAGALAGSVIAVYYLRNYIPTQTLVRMSFIIIGVGVVLVSLAFLIGYSDVFESRFSRFGGSAHLATSGRSTIWSNAIKVMLENPISFLTGYGFNAYQSSREFYAATHNIYLDYLFNLGAIGLILFLMVFARIIGVARSAISNASKTIRAYFLSLIFGLFGFLVSLFFGEYHGSGFLLWAFLGVSMRLAMEVVKSNSMADHGGVEARSLKPTHLESYTKPKMKISA